MKTRVSKTSFSLVAAAFVAPMVLSSVATADSVLVRPAPTSGKQTFCENNKGEMILTGGDCVNRSGSSEAIERFIFKGDADDTEVRLEGDGIQTTQGGSETFSVDAVNGNMSTQGSLTVGGTTTLEDDLAVQSDSGSDILTVDSTTGITSTNGNAFNTDGGDIDTGGGTLTVGGNTLTNGIDNNQGGIINAGDVSGVDSLTTDNNSTVTFGSNSTINMGDNRVQGVADPLDPTDAANKRYVDQEINKAFDEIDKNSEGIAVAMAMSGLTLPSNANFAIGAQLGFYDDEQAIAAQGALRLDENFTLIGGVGAGLGDDSPVGGRIGVQASF